MTHQQPLIPWNTRNFITVTLFVSLWIHASETFRYFLLVMPELKSSLNMINDVAPMNLRVFLIWVLWDTALAALLVFLYQMTANTFGKNRKSLLITAAFMWSIFWIIWVGVINMGILSGSILLATLPLAAVEMLIAAWLCQKLFKTNEH